MQKKTSMLGKIFDFITYTEKKDVEAFYIPEIPDTSEVENKSDTDNKSTSTDNGDNYKQRSKKQKKKETSEKNPDTDVLSSNLQDNIDFLKEKFNFPNNKDIVIRELTFGNKQKAFIAFLDGMVDRTTINNYIIRPLLKKSAMNQIEHCTGEYILENVIETNQATKVEKADDVVYSILSGDTALFVDGSNYSIVSETKGFDKRGVEKPVIEGVVQGPQEAFSENLRTNVTLVRKIVKNNSLTTEFIKIGKRNNNLCAVMYIDGLVNPAIVAEVKRRIDNLQVDYIAGEGMLEQLIEDNPWSLFPTVLSTERPDRTSSYLMEGRVAIIADGTPFSIVVPVTVTSLFHTSEDSALRWQFGTIVRFLRIVAFFVAIMLPAVYIALTTFHREMIPTDSLIAIAKARENVPFPTIVELLFMELGFELIREAGVRIPGIMGNTIGIIGGLILGQAAVQANLVSPVLIIVIAITGLGNFALPSFSLAFGVRVARIAFIISGAFIGFYGIALCLIVLLGLISSTKSFGVGMLAPIAPRTKWGTD